MRVVIDTSSLLALVRYFLPFDKNDALKKLFLNKIDIGEIIVIDKVFDESKFISKGIILKTLNIPKNKTIKTTEILPSPKFFRQLDSQLCYGSQKNRLSEIEVEISKGRFLETADAKQILYCIKDRGSLELDNPILITEEHRLKMIINFLKNFLKFVIYWRLSTVILQF